MKDCKKMIKEQFLVTQPSPMMGYKSKKTLPELAELDSDIEFSNRRIAVFNCIRDRYAASQWNEMGVKVLKLLCELEPTKIHLLVSSNTYSGTAFTAVRFMGSHRSLAVCM